MRRCFWVAMTSALGASIFEVVLFKGLGLPDDLLAIGAPTPPLALTTLAVLLVGPIEELTKYIVLRANVYLSHDFNQIFDGIVYGITIALGFSLVENIGYFFELYTTEPTAVFVVSTLYRGLFTTLGHVTFTGILGYFVGKAKFSPNNKTGLIVQGILYASLLHTGFDFLVIGTRYGNLLAIIFIVGSFALFIRIWKRPDVRMVWRFTPTPSPENGAH